MKKTIIVTLGTSALFAGVFATTSVKSEENISAMAMYRLYNPNSGEHFYTASRGEAENLVALRWGFEGIGWFSIDRGQDVYRLYNPNAGDHHYTLDVGERDALVQAGWKYEGVSWKSIGNVPLYRLYNPNAKAAGSHHYTPTEGERDSLVASGWKFEGVAWNAIERGLTVDQMEELQKQIDLQSGGQDHDIVQEGAPVYKTCEEVRAAGKAPIRQGEPGYGPHLDRDGDGVACESKRH